jgi:hypothetical protein
MPDASEALADPQNHLGVALSIHAAEQSWFRGEMGFQTLEEVLNFDRAA